MRARLEIAQPYEMLHTFRERLANAVHHCGRRFEPFEMRDFHDLQPPVRAGLFLGHLIAHPLHEDFAAAARNGVEPRLHQLANHLNRIHAVERAPKIHFTRTKAVNMDGVIALDILEQFEIPLERDVRVVAALHENLHATQRLDFVDLRTNLLIAERPPFVVLGASVEGTKAAIRHTDVGVVDVAVHDIRDDALGV